MQKNVFPFIVGWKMTQTEMASTVKRVASGYMKPLKNTKNLWKAVY